MHEKIAKITDVRLGWEDHGIFTSYLILDYGGSGQGTGAYGLDQYDKETKKRHGTAYGCDFIIRTMQACGVDEWSKIKGRTILALFKDDDSWGPVIGIKPLPTEPGKEFIFAELAAEHRLDNSDDS
jgi:hypothetical protein